MGRRTLDNSVMIHDVSSKVLRYLVEYLYGGTLNFVADDNELAVGLMSVASRYMLPKMSYAIELALIPRLNDFNAVGLHQASVAYNSSLLMNACKKYILENYERLSEMDPTREALLYVLERSK